MKTVLKDASVNQGTCSRIKKKIKLKKKTEQNKTS